MSGREAAIRPTPGAGREVQQMIKVAIEVRSGTASIAVAVQAQSMH